MPEGANPTLFNFSQNPMKLKKFCSGSGWASAGGANTCVSKYRQQELNSSKSNLLM